MKITFWGTRGSQATPGSETVRYGGNTACVEVESDGVTLSIDLARGKFPHLRELSLSGSNLPSYVQATEELIRSALWPQLQTLTLPP